MSQEQQGPLSESEMSSLAQKLRNLSVDLTPKEAWFLNESLKSGIMSNAVGDVQGYMMQSAVEGGTLYYPESYKGQFGKGQTLSEGTSLRVDVAVVGHFNRP